MSVTDTRNLSGARASSAVRCPARAIHEGIGTDGDPDAHRFLRNAFTRGANVGKAWALGKEAEWGGLHECEAEAEIPWGPGWVGHADLLDRTDKVVFEAYHAPGAPVREEKVLQACFYADTLGPDWTAELAVIDTSVVDEDEGFAVQTYEVDVDAFRDRVRSIKQRVITGVERGSVTQDDRVSTPATGPTHPECRSCPFVSACWDGWQPPAPDEIPGMAAHFDELRVVDADRKAQAAQLKRTEERRKELIEEISDVVRPGVPAVCVENGVTVKRTSVKGSLSFSLSDALKAGHALPADLEPFVKTKAGHDRWEVTT